MGEVTTTARWLEFAAQAGADAEAMRLVAARATADPVLAAALLRLPTGEDGVLLAPGALRRAAAFRDLDRAHHTACAEATRRSPQLAACACGHAVHGHARELTVDERLPCTTTAPDDRLCPCSDYSPHPTETTED